MASPSDLEFFATVMKAGTLTAAARELGVTPPAVSKRLALLEERLGARLLHRTTRRASLTHEGEVYLAGARRILDEIREMEDVLSSSTAVPRGLLRVNAPLGFGRSHIAPAVSDFAKKQAAVEVQLQLTDRPLPLVEESMDVGIRFGEIPDTRLIARRIARNRRIVCASPAYLKRRGMPKTPADLTRHDCLVLRQNESAYGTWHFTRGRKHETVKVKGRLSSNDGEAVLRWALDGHGILMRAEWDAARYLKGGQLVQLLGDCALPSADIFAVYPERHHLSAKVRAFVDFLVERFR